MLPDGAHEHTDDWTVFFRPTSALSAELGAEPQVHPHVAAGSDAEGADTGSPRCFHILSHMCAERNEEAERGATVQAIAIGTMHPCLSMFKVRTTVTTARLTAAAADPRAARVRGPA